MGLWQRAVEGWREFAGIDPPDQLVLIIDFPDDAFYRLQRLRRLTGIFEAARVIQNALKLYEWLLQLPDDARLWLSQDGKAEPFVFDYSEPKLTLVREPVRLTFEFSNGAVSRMQFLREKSGNVSDAEVVRRALRLYEWYIQVPSSTRFLLEQAGERREVLLSV